MSAKQNGHVEAPLFPEGLAIKWDALLDETRTSVRSLGEPRTMLLDIDGMSVIINVAGPQGGVQIANWDALMKSSPPSIEQLGTVFLIAHKMHSFYRLLAALMESRDIDSVDDCRLHGWRSIAIDLLAGHMEHIGGEQRTAVLNLCHYVIETCNERIEQQASELRALVSTDALGGYVYVLASTSGKHKIGKTKSPHDRMKTFGLTLPFEVEYDTLLPCSNMHEMERALHHFYAFKRVKGEWFDLDLDDLAFIKSLADGVE